MVEDVGNKFKISVWWDIENCHVPKDVDPHYVAQNMAAALQRANLTGPIEIQVFGDTTILSRATQKALTDTGITLNHVPRGNKDAADKAILVAMLLWALENPPPANILLISGDGDFASAMHRLRLKTYSILLAVPAQFVKLALTGAAKRLWFWKDMAKGQLAEPELSQVELAGSSAVENFCRRQKSLTSSSTSSTVNGYVSPQKTINNLEHFRAMCLEDGVSRDDSRLLDTKVSPGRVHSTFTSDNTTSNITHGRHPTISAGFSGKFGQHPHFLPQPGGRVEPSKVVYNNPEVSNSKLPQHADLLLEGPLQHIDPNMPIAPTALSATPEHKFSQNTVTHNYMSTNYPHPKGFTPLSPTTSSLPSAVVVHNEEKLPHDTCLNKIYSAMKTLERDMLAPTESNLLDCIHYWDPHHGKMDLKQTLKMAADLQQVTKTQLGGGLIMYFPPKHMVPWNCVDPGNMSAVHPENVWLELQEFLLHNERKQAFLSSSSRYSAGLILKSSCGMHIQNLVVGKLLSLLEQAIQVKRWLQKTGPGWSPLILNQKALLDWHGSDTSKTDWRAPGHHGIQVVQ